MHIYIRYARSIYIRKTDAAWRGVALGSLAAASQQHICQEAHDSRVWQGRMNHPDPISAGCRAFFTAALGNVLATAPKLAHSKINRIKRVLAAAGTHSRGEFSYFAGRATGSYIYARTFIRAIKAVCVYTLTHSPRKICCEIVHYFNRYGHFSPARSLKHTRVYACAAYMYKGAGMGLEFKAVNGIIEIRSSSSTCTSSLFGFESCVRAFAFASLYTLFSTLYVFMWSTSPHIYIQQLSWAYCFHAPRSQQQCVALVCACAFSHFSLSRDAIRPSSFEIPKENVII